ncbi:uncharacterized protein EV420DRAFT_737840 [Desarmillaria tabescens]|uniref:Uncharacterized protein n=1 Tax=Armillaria tabescens TaxID=1929756 RepID=A0AA39MYG7_ARMTA|nr:uncharacterized protein EV420DRAFT_737840 [Desarmillaria tabescens]KAK0450515.1 hypothetical protein EV420DRAFT_737840 [Desarmillaria tabescens]
MSDTTDGLSSDFIRRICDEYLNATFVESFTHGMYTFIFIVALTKLFSKHNTQKFIHRNVLFLVLFVMYTLATVHLAFRWKLVRSAFVVYGPEHLYVYMALASRNTLPARATYSVTSSVNILIANGIMIWRCWTFWGHKWRMIILPVLCTIGGTIFNILYILQNLDALGTHPFQDVIGGTDWAIAYYSMTLSTTIICTTLILYPMLTTEAPSGPKTNLYTYHRVIAILIESSALYALTLILLLIYLVRDDLTAPYPQVILSSVTGIAPTLIVARVALGQARPEDPRRSVMTRGSSVYLHPARVPMQTNSFRSREPLSSSALGDKSDDTLS